MNTTTIVRVRHILLSALLGISTSVSAVNNIDIITGGANDSEVSDGIVNAGDGGAVDFSIGPGAIESFVGDVLLASTLDITITDIINKLNGGLSFTPGGSLFIRSGSVSTSGTQIYNGAVILDGQPGGVSVPTNLTGSTVTFGSTLDGVTFQSNPIDPLTDLPSQELTVTGNSVFNGVVGGNTALKSLTVTGTTGINGGAITTTGAQTYTGNVTLGADAALTNGAGTAQKVTFDGDVDGAFALSVANDVVFNGNVGALTSLTTVTVNGGNNAIFNNAPGAIFNGSLSSALTIINDTGTTQFNGGVLNTGAIQANGNAVFNTAASAGAITVNGTTSINGDLTTTGAQTYVGATTLGASAILNGGGNVTFGDSVDAGTFDLTVSNSAVFNGNVDANELTLLGSSSFDGSVVTTTLAQDYTNSVTVAAGGATFDAPDVTFSDLLGGAGNVIVEGMATFKRDTTPFSLTVNGDTVFDSTPAVLDLTINTVAEQIYNGNVIFTGPAGKAVSMQAAFNDIVFGGTISGVNQPELTLDGNNVSFNGDVTGLGSLKTTTGSDTAIWAGGLVETDGDLRLDGDLILGVNTTLSTTNTISDVVLRNVDSALTDAQNNPIGIQNLTVGNAGQSIKILGAIGGIRSLDNLTLTTGDTILLANDVSVTTSSDQTYNGYVELNHSAGLGGDVTTLKGYNITFAQTIDAQTALDASEVLDITVAGAATFNGKIGNFNPLDSIKVAGASNINGGAVTTLGAQTYNGAVILGAATALTNGSGMSNQVTFGGFLDSDAVMPRALSISKDVEFADKVGSIRPLQSLLVGGASKLNGGFVETVQGQTYTGAVTLGGVGAAVILNNGATMANQIKFGSTLDGAKDLTIKNGAEFNGVVGGITPLSSLTAGGLNSPVKIKKNINVIDDQVFKGPVNIAFLKAGDATRGTLTGTDITFDSTVSIDDIDVNGDLVAGTGKLAIDGDLTLGMQSELFVNIGGTATGQFDAIEVTNGGALLFGKITVDLVNGFTPMLGDTFDIIIATDAAGFVADFASFMLPALGGGLGFAINSDFSDLLNFADLLQLEVVAVPVPAALWLFVSGLLGLIGVARAPKNTSAIA